MRIKVIAFIDILIEKINLKLGFSRKKSSHIICKKSDIISKEDYKKLKEAAEEFKNRFSKGEISSNKTKSFIYSKYKNGNLAEIEKEDPILKLANSIKLIELIKKDFKIERPQLYKANYWWIPPAKSGAKRDMSQKWHIDPEGNKVMKVFMYFHDVSDSCMQINPSIRGSKISSLFSKSAVGSYGLYPNSKQQKIIDKHKNNIVDLRLNEENFFIADTSHLHRGGYSKIEGRLSCFLAYKPFR